MAKKDPMPDEARQALDDVLRHATGAEPTAPLLGGMQRQQCEQMGFPFQQAKTWRPRLDPLIIDLDGDGIETLGTDAGILFDHDGNGIRTNTGWVAGDDGFLVLDRNGNGTIDDGGELFGDETLLSDGNKAADGFAALADVDSNQDGVIDANDAEFGNLRVWRDIHSNGVAAADELYSLSELGISTISLQAVAEALVTENGTIITHSGQFIRTDSTTGTIADAVFVENKAFSAYTSRVAVSDAASLQRETPRLCRGGSQSLTDTGVHRGNSEA